MTDVNINLPILQKTEYEMLPTMLKNWQHALCSVDNSHRREAREILTKVIEEERIDDKTSIVEIYNAWLPKKKKKEQNMFFKICRYHNQAITLSLVSRTWYNNGKTWNNKICSRISINEDAFKILCKV